MAENLELPALQAFADAIKKDPSILFAPQLKFLRDALSVYGDLKLPSHEHSHDHDHSHHDDCCDHEKKGCPFHHEASSHDHGHEHDHHEAESDGEEDLEKLSRETEPSLPLPTGGEDWEGSAACKEQANEAKMNGNFEFAVQKFTESMNLGQVSALTLANRAECLLKLRRPLAAISDCSHAITLNPDSAKALRCRGKAHRFLHQWDEALTDLAAAQRIDFDPDLNDMVKMVTAKVAKKEAKKTQKRNEEEQKLRERLLRRKAEIEEAQRREREEAEAAAHGHNHSHGHSHGHSHEADEDPEVDSLPEDFPGMGGMGGFPGMGGMGGMPGMGGMGGMPGMGGMGGAGGGMQQMLMQLLMSDPELSSGLQNPKIVKAFSDVMSGGGPSSPAAQKAMQDPEVAVFMQKMMAKLGPLMGGMGGGMPGMGGKF